MFSFFKKSKKDTDKKTRDPSQNKEGSRSPQGEHPGKNNRDGIVPKPAPESDSETVPNHFPESETGLRKDVSTAAASVPTQSDKLNANPDIIATMSHETAKKPPTFGAKPCGHGTTPITPRVPSRSTNSTPSASPVLEVRRHFRISGIESVNHIQENGVAVKEDTVKVNDVGSGDTVAGSPRLQVKSSGEAVNDQSDTKNLINQEAKFQSQLNDISKQLSLRDAEANKLKFQMEELQRDVFAKSAGMDRLESELNAAQKECETIRQRIRTLESELDNQKLINNQLSTDISEKTDAFQNFEQNSKHKIGELEDTIKELRTRINDLEHQLKTLRDEKDCLEKRHAELITERDEEKKKVAETLEQAQMQKEEMEKKWKEDFEKLRTINIMKEQDTLDDFEWKLREVQQKCNMRLEEKDKAVEEKLQEAYKAAEEKMKQAEDMTNELENLKIYETEVEQLRSLTTDQKEAMKKLEKQQEEMRETEENLKSETKKLRNLMEMEKENLQHMQRVHHQEILDKERHLKQTLQDKRTEIAVYWEERLLNECARLKSELEQIHDEEKWNAMETVRKTKDEDFEKAKKDWDTKLTQCLKEVSSLKKSLAEKDKYYKEEMVSQQTETDRELMELRRLMDKIDMMHHEKYEKLVSEHDSEIDLINLEHEKRIQENENYWKTQISSVRNSLEAVKEQMEKESQQKMEMLIQKHRNELDEQWDNLIHQKSEAIQLLEEEYISKYRTLEEQFYTQQKSHSLREVELLKTIDSLKNELHSKESTIQDLQNNVDTLEGGVQVLNQEIAQQCEDITKIRRESDQRIKGLLETIANLQEVHEKENESYRLKFLNSQKQSQETIDHLQKKCQCLNKLFEEVRQRYERRDSRQEDLNKISDLKQIIAEQEKDLACINEEKRYFQMKLMALEKHLEENVSAEDEEFEDAHTQPLKSEALLDYAGLPNGPVSIPPTIPEVMASRVPTVVFNNGQKFPIFGLGTWKSKPGEVTQAVKDAIDIGYRHIDCAHVYGNEKEVGAALAAKFADGTVKREDLFITSKLWNTMHRPDLVEPALKETLKNLGLKYLDLYLIHWPFALKEDGDLFPKNADGTTAYSDVDYVDTWKAMEEVQKKGLTKSIGVSNFNKKQMERVLQNCSIPPATNQIEVHPYLNQQKLIDYLKSKNIVVTAYSPLGSPDRPWAKPEDPQLLEDAKILQIAKKYSKTPAQVVLKYQVQRGCITIPKSVTKSRIQQNFDIWDFNLSQEDIDLINTFDCNGRICPYDDSYTHKDHPFINDEY